VSACGVTTRLVGADGTVTISCDLEAGHDVSVGRLDNVESLTLARERMAAGRPFAAVPHRASFEWTTP
jgi:hypothetical protein